jgi:Tol biopolymer transport system component/DNA-binding winged helix-turn-helix (wHTH) protein
MVTSRSRPTAARFDQFEVDFGSNELRKNGVRMPMQDQPFQVLRLLLEAEGKVVMREQLRSALWSADTFVDFEHSVNTAVGKLRHALGDSPDNPKFIETLPKIGYRFIAFVEWVPESTSKEALHLVIPIDRSELEPPEPESMPTKPRWWKRKATIAVAISLLVAMLLYPWVAPSIERLVRLYELQQLTAVPLTALPGTVWSPTFSPDGSQIAFGWDGGSANADRDLYVKVIGSDKLLRLTHDPRGVTGAAWSPDGKNIALWRLAPAGDSGVFLIPPLGGPERKIASAKCFCMFGSALSWSPDGKQLAFLDHPDNSPSDNTVRLFVLSLNSMERVPVKTDCNLVLTPTFSPHGDYLAWGCIDQHVSIFLQRMSDGRVSQLVRGLDGLGGLNWSSDGRHIVFSTSFTGGDLWEVSLARPNHPEKLPLGHDATNIAVSPGGKRLAFVQNHRNTNIWRVDLSDPKAKAQKVVASSREQRAPNYSPDGAQVAFDSNRSGSYEVWVSDSDGSNAVQLSSFGTLTGLPHWSPDAKMIAFDSWAGRGVNLYLIDPHGGVPHKLSIDLTFANSPSWSHDGKWIYFEHGADAGHPTIWKVPSQGGHAEQLTKDVAWWPLESPDGRYVYFSRELWIWRVRTDGTEEQKVEGMPRVAGAGDAWYPYGSGIYFLAYANGKAEIDFFDLDTKKAQSVFVLDKFPPEWMGGMHVSQDGRWLLFPQLDESSSDLMLVENWQ